MKSYSPPVVAKSGHSGQSESNTGVENGSNLSGIGVVSLSQGDTTAPQPQPDVVPEVRSKRQEVKGSTSCQREEFQTLPSFQEFNV